jgi:D5 N terminal like/Bifunctional DNA primase/polymerase, N-terminal
MPEDERPIIAAAREILRQGHWPLPIQYRHKGPRLKGWQDLRLSQSDLPSYFANESNIGILLGKPSRGLVDVDLDATETLSVADTLLPSTNRIHGRHSKPRSHRWYVCNSPPPPMKFSDTNDQCLVELRSTGQQTVVPPSIHPSGEELYWEWDGDPAVVGGDELLRSVGQIAAASLLIRHWPNRGSRHETALALHGLLLRADWTTEEAEHFVGVVASAAGDEEWRSRAADGRTTAKRLATDATATGRPRLVQIFGKEIVERVSTWLGLSQKHATVVEQTHLSLTDLGNAKRFASAYRKDVRFCYRRRKWLVWDDQRWVWDDTGTIQEHAKLTAIAMLSEAAEEPDDEKRKKLRAWQKQSECEHSIGAMITLAQSEDGIPVRVEELDCDPMLFNFQNGTMNLTTQEFREHRRADLITKIAPISYDLNATCPKWLAFLSRIMNGNNELVTFLQRVVSYSLTGDTSEHALFLLYGTGANGKTTFLEVLRYAFGDYVMSADFGSFVVSRGASVRNDLARLAGARLSQRSNQKPIAAWLRK